MAVHALCHQTATKTCSAQIDARRLLGRAEEAVGTFVLETLVSIIATLAAVVLHHPEGEVVVVGLHGEVVVVAEDGEENDGADRFL